MRQMAHTSSPTVRVATLPATLRVAMIALVHFDTEALAARAHSQVLSTTGLRNYYTFHSGLQAQEIRLGSPDRFSS